MSVGRRHWIGCNCRIYRDDGQSMLQRLANQHPVERIAVQSRQLGQICYGIFIYGEAADKVPLPLEWQIRLWRLWKWQLAQLILDDRFPHGSHTQVNIIVRVADAGLSRYRKPLIATNEPQEDVRVEK